MSSTAAWGRRTKVHIRLSKNTALQEFTDFDASLRQEILDVLRELAIPTQEDDPDEGSWTPSENSRMPREQKDLVYYFRRGLTRAKRAELNRKETQELDLDEGEIGTNSWDYFIIYRETTSNECIREKCSRGITVERIWPTSKVLSKLNLREALGALI